MQIAHAAGAHCCYCIFLTRMNLACHNVSATDNNVSAPMLGFLPNESVFDGQCCMCLALVGGSNTTQLSPHWRNILDVFQALLATLRQNYVPPFLVIPPTPSDMLYLLFLEQ